MLPDFSLVRKVLRKKQQDFFNDAIRVHSGELFGGVSKTILHEGSEMESVYSPELKYASELKKLETSYNYQVPDVLKNPGLIFTGFFAMAKDFADQQVTMAIKTISDVTTLAMYEKVEFSFDEKDQPILPSIVAGPEMSEQISAVLLQVKDDESFKARMEEIIVKQRNRWNDRENNRKLVD